MSSSQSPRSKSSRPRPDTATAGIQSKALEHAAEALRAGRFEAAEHLAASVLMASRSNRQAAQLLGQALLLQGRPDAAIEALRGPARRSQDPVLETLLARALAEAGRQAAALDQLRAAATRRPAYPLAFLELGDLIGRLGRLAEAAEVFEAGLALAPDAAVLGVGLAYNCLHRNDREGARRLFSQVRAAAPGRHDALVGLAHVVALDGESAAAAGLYRQALELRPDDAATRVSLGKCLLEAAGRGPGEAQLRLAARSGPQMSGEAITAMAATPHGRLFLRPSAAAAFLAA